MHKNWKQICKLGSVDWCLMMALAHVDVKTPTGRRLMKAFPKCFSAKKEVGPIPLSVLKDYAEKNPENYSGPEQAIASLVFEDTLSPYQLPFIRLAATDAIRKQYGFPLLPKEISSGSRIGDKVRFQGEEYIVVENCAAEICLTPASCIHVDIKPYYEP